MLFVCLLDDGNHPVTHARREIALQIKEGEKGVRLLSPANARTTKGRVRYTLQSTLVPAHVVLEVSVPELSQQSIALETLPVVSDADEDGLPDIAELTSAKDRENFLKWFTVIAEAQYYCLSPLWNENERDCAGLIRFAYREALKTHDSAWLSQISFVSDPVIPDVERFQYPDVPLLGTALFRTKPGPFKLDEIDSAFTAFAQGKYLQAYNATYLGKEPSVLQKGDLLFFFHYDDPEMPYHGIIFIGDDNGVLEPDKDDWLVYHTGPVDGTRGVVKKLRLAELRNYPEEKWRPVRSNPFFLGYYRWKIVE